MTITAGNSNNGIPMGGYVPGTGSGGGGGGGVYRYKGSVPTYTALPAENLETGDVYNVIDTDMNYAWTGTAWDPLGSTVDLSPYYTGAQVEAKLLQKQDAITFGQGLSYAKIVSQISCIVDNGDGTYKGLLSDTNATSIPYTVAGTNLYCNIPTTERGNQVLDGSRVLFYTGSVVGKVIKQGPSWTPSDDTKNDRTLTQKSIMLGNINSENKFTPKFIFWTGYNGATTPEHAYHRISRINSTIASGADPYNSNWDCFATEYNVSDTTLLLNHTSTANSATVGLNNRPFKITLGTSTEGNLTARVEYPSNSYTTPNPIDLGITVEEANELNCVVFSVPYYRVGYPYHTNFADTGIFDGDSQIWTPTPQSTSQLSNLSVNYDNSTIKINDSGQLYAVSQSSIDPDDYYDKNNVDALLNDKANKIDLDKKENKITTTGALTLTEKVMSNLNDMSITDDGLGAFSIAGSMLYASRSSWSDESNSCVIGSARNTYFTAGEYTADSWRGGFIDMPYTFGYTIKVPSNAVNYCGYAGKYDAEGRFIPIISLAYSHNAKSIVYSNSFTLVNETSSYTVLRGQATAAEGKSPYVRTSGGRSKNYGWTLKDKTYGYLQWVIESNGFITQIYRDPQTTDTRFMVATSTDASVESIARWKEVSVIRFAPTLIGTSAIGISSKPFSIADFGLYPTDKKIYEYASENDLIATGNLFDLSGQTIQNYLELNLGSGLSVEDNKLVCTASVPENVTTQGNTFNGANQLVQLDSTGKLPAVDGSQLTNLSGYTLPAANDTTLGGVKVSTGSSSSSNSTNIFIENQQIKLLSIPKFEQVDFTSNNRAFTNTFRVINVNNTQMLGASGNLGVTDNYSCYIHADGNSGEVVAQAPSGIGSNAYGRLQIKDYNNGASNYCELFLNANKKAWNGVTDPHNRITSNTDILEISRYIDGYQVYHNIDTGNLQDNIVAGTNITTSVDDDGKVTINSTSTLKHWTGTQTEYDGITEKDANTLYIITG